MADLANPYKDMVRALMRLWYRPDDSDMSYVEEAPPVKEGFESRHVQVGDLLGNPHGRCTEMVTKKVLGDVYLSAKPLFGSGLIIGGDDLDVALGAEKGKGPPRLEDEISKMSMYISKNDFSAYFSYPAYPAYKPNKPGKPCHPN